MKYEICKYISEKSHQIPEHYFAEVELLKKINVGGIITTNWDTFLETLFPSHTPHIGQESLLFFNKIALGEVFKIHGSITAPNSLILTDKDYEDFNKKYPYLAAKLLTIFVEQPIIFLGYSIEDPNIIEILKSIVGCLSRENIDKLKDRMIFCKWDRQGTIPTIEDSSLYIPEATIPIKLLKMNSFVPFYEVLAGMKRKFPLKVLKHMQNMIYDFVKSAEPTGKVYVDDNIDFNDLQNVEFVYGVGLKEKLSEVGAIGYNRINRHLLFDDLFEEKGWDSTRIATEVLPALSKGPKYIPYFKHLRLAGLLDDNGQLITEDYEFTRDFVNKVGAVTLESFYFSQDYARKKGIVNENCNSIADVLQEFSILAHRLQYIPLLDIEKIDLEDLAAYIKECKPQVTKTHETLLFKLYCLYDFIKYKLDSPND